MIGTLSRASQGQKLTKSISPKPEDQRPKTKDQRQEPKARKARIDGKELNLFVKLFASLWVAERPLAWIKRTFCQTFCLVARSRSVRVTWIKSSWIGAHYWGQYPYSRGYKNPHSHVGRLQYPRLWWTIHHKWSRSPYKRESHHRSPGAGNNQNALSHTGGNAYIRERPNAEHYTREPLGSFSQS